MMTDDACDHSQMDLDTKAIEDESWTAPTELHGCLIKLSLIFALWGNSIAFAWALRICGSFEDQFRGSSNSTEAYSTDLKERGNEPHLGAKKVNAGQ